MQRNKPTTPPPFSKGSDTYYSLTKKFASKIAPRTIATTLANWHDEEAAQSDCEQDYSIARREDFLDRCAEVAVLFAKTDFIGQRERRIAAHTQKEKSAQPQQDENGYNARISPINRY